MIADEAVALADRALARARKRRRPPTYREFAATTILPAGPLKGHPFDPNSDPCQSYLIDQLDAGRWERIFVCTPPQIGGKTTVGVLVPALRNAIALRLPVGYGLPTLQDLDKAWAEKLKPALAGSGYGGHLPKAGPGARGGRGHTLQFSDPETGELEGMLVFLAGGAYGSTVAAAIVDEVDQFRTAEGAPLWSALEDIFARADAYGRRALRIAVGTIENDDRTIILVLVNEHGTGTRPWWPCPHCNRFRMWSWEDVHYDGADEETARASARLTCPACASLISDGERLRALPRMQFVHRGQAVDDAGQITGPVPRTTSLGLLWTALDSVRSNLGELAVDHLRARKQIDLRNDHGLMRKFVRYRLCDLYTGDVNGEDAPPQQLTRAWLVARSAGSEFGLAPITREKGGDSAYCAAECPPGPEALFLGVDVQRGGKEAPGRLYYVLMGVASDFRTWDLAYGSHILAPVGIQPTEAELHKGLDWLHEYSAALAAQYGRPIVRRLVDIGDRQDEIRRWQMRHAKDWWCVKGVAPGMKATDAFDLQDWVYKRKMDGGRWYAYEVDVQLVRFQAQAQYLVPPGKPGSAMLPRGVGGTDSLIKHYCATALIPDGRGGTRWSGKAEDRKYHFEFQFRHDLLDCRTYALALAKRWLRDLERKRSFDEYQKGDQSGGNTTGSWLGEVLSDV